MEEEKGRMRTFQFLATWQDKKGRSFPFVFVRGPSCAINNNSPCVGFLQGLQNLAIQVSNWLCWGHFQRSFFFFPVNIDYDGNRHIMSFICYYQDLSLSLCFPLFIYNKPKSLQRQTKLDKMARISLPS